MLMHAWHLALLNDILRASFISNSINKRYLLLTDVSEMVSVFDNPPTISLIYSLSKYYQLFLSMVPQL